MKATNASSVSITIATPARVSATPTRSTTDDREDAMSEALAATLRLDVEAYQRAASTALAELRLFLDTGDNDRLHSFVSWSHTADSARDVLKRKAGM